MRPYRNIALCHFEPLECRHMLSAAIATPISDTFVTNGAGNTTIDLTPAFSDPAVTLVNLATNVGPIDLSLTPLKTPGTVANFLEYVTSGDYNGSIIHREVSGFVEQGGGYNGVGAALPAFRRFRPRHREQPIPLAQSRWH